MTDQHGHPDMDARAREIAGALEAATQGKWEWKGRVAPDWMPNTYGAVDDLRVQIATPDKDTDFDLWFVLQAMKSGFIMVRNADAELIANAPAWLRDLLAERERLLAVVEAARELLQRGICEEDAEDRRLVDALQTAVAALDADAGEG